MSIKIPLIIDCDPGIDDAYAIIYAALNSSFDLKAIVSVAGNVPIENTTENADFLMSQCNLDIPLIKGANKPLIGEPIIAKYAHGSNGLGGYLFDASFKSSLINTNPVDTVYAILKNSKQKISIAAIGPLTNIAKLYLAYPDVINYVKDLFIMGGAIKRGNYTARAEFNIAADPLAAKIVLNAGFNVYMLPLDTSESIHFKKDFFESLKTKTKRSKLLYDIVDAKLNFDHQSASSNIYLHDMLTLCACAHPEYFEFIKCNINVETDGNLTKGETIFDLRETERRLQSNATYIAFKEHDLLIQHLLEVLTHD